MSRILGVDFTSAPSRRKPITIARGELEGDVLCIAHVDEVDGFEGFEAMLAEPGPFVSGLDFPFGLPRRFVDSALPSAEWASMVRAAGALGRERFCAITYEAFRAARGDPPAKHRAVDLLARAHSPLKTMDVVRRFCVTSPMGLPRSSLERTLREAIRDDPSGDRLDAVLCAVQAATASRLPRFVIPEREHAHGSVQPKPPDAPPDEVLDHEPNVLDAEEMQIDIGIDAKKREEIATGLSRVLADTYTLYLKTHNFHWNVTGPMFQTLHLMFETQYNELAVAVDLVAERIRALGLPAPGTYKQFTQLSAITEDEGVPKAQDMIELLVRGHETVARTAREVFRAADDANDQPTCDLLTQRMQVHEKTAWMLRSLLE